MSPEKSQLQEVEPPITDLEQAITQLAGHLNAGAYELIRLIGDFDRRGGWARQGITSCAHWLNWKIGLAMGAGREKVRVARALPDLPKISAAFAAGKISYSKVRAMTRIATPNNEDSLLNIALHGTANHMEKLVRGMRFCERAEQLKQANENHDARRVHWYHDETGQLQLHANLPPELGALVVEALEAARNDLPDADDVSAETPKAHADFPENNLDNHRADALVLLAEAFLASGPASLKGSDAHHVVVHVSAETLCDGFSSVDNEDCCELEGGPGLPPETVRRLTCDSSLVGLVKNANGDVLDVGRKTRGIPTPMRRALIARDRGCRFPGCTHTRYVDGHHIQHWAQGGETKLSNLLLLCRRHHRLIHEGGFQISRHASGLSFRDPNGQTIQPDCNDTEGNIEALLRKQLEHGLQIDPETAVTRWAGETMDYDMAIEGLMRDRDRLGMGGQSTQLNQ